MSVVAEFAISGDVFPIADVVASYDDVTVEVERIVPLGNQPIFFWVVGSPEVCDAVVAELREPAAAGVVEVIDELPDRVLLRSDTSASKTSFLALVEEVDGTILSAEEAAGDWVISLRFPSQQGLVALSDGCRELGIALELRATHGVEPGDGATRGDYDLSPRQAETLRLALREGYFNVPREASIRELAEKLGVSDQAVSERLRRGVSTLIGSTIRDRADARRSDERRTS